MTALSVLCLAFVAGLGWRCGDALAAALIWRYCDAVRERATRVRVWRFKL